MPIGFFPEVNYTTCELIIPPNSKLYIFSDGIFEVMQEHRKPWGMPKFLNFLAEKFSKCEEINADLVLEKIRSETPNAQFQDDVTLLQINFS
jgi:sigma-B regulation protein RsbU (phosphoserine phosphatase)